MPIHTVSLTTDAYNRLKKLKHGSESFSEAIIREIPDKAETAGELLDLAEARFLGKNLLDAGLMATVEKGRKPLFEAHLTMLLDTQFLINFERELRDNRTGPARKFLGSNRRQPVFVSVISYGEIAAGMPDNQTARDFFAIFKRVLSLFPELGLRAAQIDRELIRVGARLGENDNWLAGTALYYAQPIVSNDDDFDRVQGLRRIGY